MATASEVDFNIDDMSDEAALAMCALIGATVLPHFTTIHLWRYSFSTWRSMVINFPTKGDAARAAIYAHHNGWSYHEAVLNQENSTRNSYGKHLRR